MWAENKIEKEAVTDFGEAFIVWDVTGKALANIRDSEDFFIFQLQVYYNAIWILPPLLKV